MTEKLDRKPTDDQKRTRILDGALKVFLAYGYARTTMDDIARAAEVSRPALYLVFRNKTDIYRAIGACFLSTSVARAREALCDTAIGGGFEERVMTALDRALFETMAMINASPHGEEILDMKNSLAADLIGTWRDEMAGVLECAIADEAARRGADLGGRDLSPRALADMLLDTLEGMKARGVSNEDAHAATRRLVTVVGLAIAP